MDDIITAIIGFLLLTVLACLTALIALGTYKVFQLTVFP